ncbi:MAG: hypothetical protein KKE20_06465 [Nanoarchaeota archaeon]|nr:hypothetical protein [Nanoarchaeota archaeon]
MERDLGIYYTHYLYIFKEDFGDMSYYEKDLNSMGLIIEKKLAEDPDYFRKAKNLYDLQMKDSAKFYDKIKKTDLKKVSDGELMAMLKKASERISYSVAVAHIIEPYVLTTDFKIKKELEKFIKNKTDLNRTFTLLMAPVKESFANRYENALRNIKNKQDIMKVIEEFFWIRDTYAGRHILTEKDIKEEMASIKAKQPVDLNKLAEEKKNAISRLNLPEALVFKIETTEFLTFWQDERKVQILMSLDYADRIMEEVSRRVGLDIRYARQALPEEIDLDRMKSKEFQDTLRKRREGFIYVYNYKYNPKTDLPDRYTGKDYDDFVKAREKEKNIEVKELTGMTASTGTAIGPARICTTIESLKKVKEGDVLVASMTRPEYVPAMRKAAAIITDEGGITCHAAIVSRELGIPCIIGTKNATKVLKDEDLLEIKGNHGLVIILERK